MLTLPGNYDTPTEYTDHLCDFIATPLVRQITGGVHVNDALIHDAWQKLPREWTTWWSSWSDHRLAQQNLIDSIDETAGEKEAENDRSDELACAGSRPESLTKWLNTLKHLALPRAQRQGPTILLPAVLSSRMDAKKSAEVSRTVAYIRHVCQQRGISRIIDMGSGQGYISVSLAYLFPHLRLLSIDGSPSQAAGLRSFATSLDISESRLQVVVQWIDDSTALAATIQEWADGEKCMLVGLHACGSLTEHILRYFKTVPCIDAVAAVGCCYNHITPGSSSHPTGFPISSALRQREFMLSSTALMTGCQAPNNWKRPDAQAGSAEDSAFSKRRLYRAILEKMFHDKGIEISAANGNRPVWGTRKGDLTDFATYARRAMDRLGVDRGTVTAAELAVYEERYGKFQGQIAILWTLSVLCCKVVESVIAMDRFWFLREDGAHGVDIVPIFDMKISPRNLMLVAQRTKSENKHLPM